MRTIEVTHAKTGKVHEIAVSPLSRKEVKGLKKYGYSMLGCVPKEETFDDAVDKALEAGLSKEDLALLGDCGNRDTYDAWQAVLKATYGDKAEEKNCQSTSGGSTAGSATNTADDAESTKETQTPA